MTLDYTSIKVVLYKSKMLANGEHPLMLRIIKNRKTKYLSLGVSLPLKHWDEKEDRPKRTCPNRDKIEAIIDVAIQKHKSQVLEFKSVEQEFTPEAVVAAVNNPRHKVTVFQYFAEIISSLTEANRIGYANSHRDTFSSLRRYTNGKDLYFREVNYAFLSGYETWMRSKGSAETTMAVYFRTLRGVFNKAIKAGSRAERTTLLNIIKSASSICPLQSVL